jgi:hypothetical protein
MIPVSGERQILLLLTGSTSRRLSLSIQEAIVSVRGPVYDIWESPSTTARCIAMVHATVPKIRSQPIPNSFNKLAASLLLSGVREPSV